MDQETKTGSTLEKWVTFEVMGHTFEVKGV